MSNNDILGLTAGKAELECSADFEQTQEWENRVKGGDGVNVNVQNPRTGDQESSQLSIETS